MKAVAVCLKLKEQFAEVPTPEVQNAGDFLETRTFIVSAVNPRTSKGGGGTVFLIIFLFEAEKTCFLLISIKKIAAILRKINFLKNPRRRPIWRTYCETTVAIATVLNLHRLASYNLCCIFT